MRSSFCLFALAAAALVQAPLLAGDASAAKPPAGRFFGGADGEELTWEDVVRRARAAAVVYVGEKHDDPVHHRLQLAVLDAVRSENPEVSLGMEMLERPQQESVDRHVVRRETDEDAFLRESQFRERWGFPWKLYQPFFRYAREHRVRVVALNAPKDLVTKVRKVGFEGLDAKDARSLPAIDLGDAGHRRRVLRHIKAAHHGAAGPEAEAILERYYDAMCVWDEVMADSVLTEFLRVRSSRHQVVVIAGRGHVEGGDGIPGRVARRFPHPSLTIVPADEGERPGAPVLVEGRPVGDVVFFPKRFY